MVAQTRYKEAEYKYYYPSVCQGTAFQYFGKFYQQFESVESYRGPKLRIAVGSKRRRVFHPFTRYRYSFNAASIFRWCPGGNRNLVGFNIPQVNIIFCMDIGDLVSNPLKGDWPAIGRARLEKLIVERHEMTKAKLFSKAHEPAFDGLVFMAELGETLTGVKDILQGTVKALTRAGVIRKLVLNPQDLWLWYRYALMPAILSVNDLLLALSQRAKIDRIQTGSRKKTTKTSGTLKHPGWDMGTGSLITLEMPWECETTISRGGALDFHFLHDPNPWGFGSVDVFRAVYERIPFSFIFDWFIKLGDWLQNLRELQYELVQSYSTVAVQTVTKFKAGPNCMYLGAEPVLTSFYQDRIVGLEPPYFPLVDKEWRNTLRTIDAISLTIGFLKRILKRR